jgi:hypothetical protein
LALYLPLNNASQTMTEIAAIGRKIPKQSHDQVPEKQEH